MYRKASKAQQATAEYQRAEAEWREGKRVMEELAKLRGLPSEQEEAAKPNTSCRAVCVRDATARAVDERGRDWGGRWHAARRAVSERTQAGAARHGGFRRGWLAAVVIVEASGGGELAVIV